MGCFKCILSSFFRFRSCRCIFCQLINRFLRVCYRFKQICRFFISRNRTYNFTRSFTVFSFCSNFARIYIKLHGAAGRIVCSFHYSDGTFAVDEVHGIVRFHKVTSFAVVLQVPTRIQHVGNCCRIVAGVIDDIGSFFSCNRCRLVVFTGFRRCAVRVKCLFVGIVHRRQVAADVCQLHRFACVVVSIVHGGNHVTLRYFLGIFFRFAVYNITGFIEFIADFNQLVTSLIGINYRSLSRFNSFLCVHVHSNGADTVFIGFTSNGSQTSAFEVHLVGVFNNIFIVVTIFG